MGKKLIVVAGLAGLVGATYVWRDKLDQYLPAPLAKAAHGALALVGVKGKDAASIAQDDREPAKSAAPSKKGAAGAAPVTVATATLSEMPIILSAPGTVEALATVAIKPRVDGQIVNVGFKEGDMVQAGAVLYQLDDRLVRAQIKQAEAQIASDRAALKDAASISERRDALQQKRLTSEAAGETARQQVEVLKAKIAAGQAQLEMQRTQLDYLTIRAPITGRTGSMAAKHGSFVRSADPAPLLTINQTKPIAVAFALPQSNLQSLKSALDRGSLAQVKVPGTTPLEVTGKLGFVDNQVDKTTGTVTAKVMVENTDETLWPGLAVNVDLTVETRANLISVPASAVLPAQEGMIAWVVGADNRASVRSVVLDRVIGQVAYLTSGLQPGDQVVTDGQLRLAPGAAVTIRGAPGSKSIPGAAARSGRLPAKSGAPGENGSAGGG
jgi:multidrug efflux system membrane fusion protein